MLVKNGSKVTQPKKRKSIIRKFVLCSKGSRYKIVISSQILLCSDEIWMRWKYEERIKNNIYISSKCKKKENFSELFFPHFGFFLLKRQNHVSFSSSFTILFSRAMNSIIFSVSYLINCNFPRTYRRFNELSFSARRWITFFYRIDRKW